MSVQQRLSDQMTRAQAFKLRSLSREAYQPKMYEPICPRRKPREGSKRSKRKSSWPIHSDAEPNQCGRVVRSTRRVTTGHNGEDGRGTILPVSVRDINASVRASI